MALSCTAVECDEWREKLGAAQTACEDGRTVQCRFRTTFDKLQATRQGLREGLVVTMTSWIMMWFCYVLLRGVYSSLLVVLGVPLL